jgi:multidrug resistance efflux pump
LRQNCGANLAAAALAIVPVQERAAGQFRLRSVSRQEVRAPAAGFLRAVDREEGQSIDSGAVVVRLEQPDLAMRLARKRAEIAQTSAKIRLTRAGAGSSPDSRSATSDVRAAEIEAERAALAGLVEEAKYLESLQEKLIVRAAVAGTIATPHLRERIGQYLQEGELICLIEDTAELEAELLLPEQEVRRVRPGQPVEIRARSLPLKTFHGTVRRVAPIAAAPPSALNPNVPVTAPAPPPTQNSIAVYCSVDARDDGADPLRPGMTGHARVHCGRTTVGRLLLEKAMRAVRTEFW